MRKILSALLILAIVSMLFTGCSGKGTTVSLNKNGLVEYDAFRANFEELVSKLPNFTIEHQEDLPLEDDMTCHAFLIKNAKLDKSYKYRVYVSKDSEVLWVYLGADRDKNDNLPFAKLSFCMYKAMGCPQMRADAFYDKYNLLSNEDIFEMEAFGKYSIISMTMSSSKEITFAVRTTDSIG